MSSMLYFGYGSNCDLETLASYLRSHRVDPTEVTDARRAVLHDYRIRTNYRTSSRWGAANIEVHPGGVVEGVLMEISSGVHESLRKKEGWPRLYRETAVLVRVPSRRRWVVALTYRVTERYRLQHDLPLHSEYRQQILKGAESFKFSAKYRRCLYRVLGVA